MEHIDDTSIITPDSQQNFPPKTWLVESVLVTVFCCQILGIIGIINAASVESKFYRGDIPGAQKHQKLAKTNGHMVCNFMGYYCCDCSSVLCLCNCTFCYNR